MIRHLLTAQNDQDKIAVLHGTRHIPYRTLTQQAKAIQHQLLQQKHPNPHIAIYLPNGADYIAAFWGTLMAGMTAFPLNILLTGHELAPLLAQASAYTVLTLVQYRPLLVSVMAEAFAAEPSIIPEIICVDEFSPMDLESQSEPAPTPVSADTPMIFLATSGTTGKAKIVQLTEHNVASCAFAFLDKMDYEKYPQDEIRIMLGTPFSAVYGLMILCACLIRSYPVVVLGETFTLDMIYRAAAEHRVTHYEGGASVALLMEQTAGRPIPYDISSLKYFGFGGSKLTSATLSKLAAEYPGVEFWPGYGMTEAAPLIAKPYKKLNMAKLDAVGTAIKGMTIMVEADGIITDEPYTKGEIIVKGPTVMPGYYNNEEETRKILKNGYLYTGDIGYLDDEGYLYICGRRKNVIMARGFSVYAEEVEACILGSGLVNDCVVYGEADDRGNEVVCADIIPAAPAVGTEQIHAYCQIHLTGYKRPRRIHLVDRIEKTVTNKSVANKSRTNKTKKQIRNGQ